MTAEQMARGFAELTDAKAEYEKRRQYADGTRPEVFLSQRDYNRLGQVGSRYRINFLATAIDAPCDLIEVASITVPSDQAATERVQSDVWDANNLLEEYPALVRMVATYGDAYWITYEGAGDDDAKINLHRPTTVRAIYSGTETRTPDFWIQTWTVKVEGSDRKMIRGNVYTVTEDGGGEIEEWIADEDKGAEPGGWSAVVRDGAEDNVIAHDYGQIVWHFRINSTPHGTPAHEAGYGAQDAITKLIVSHMGAVDYTVTPMRWALERENAGEGDSDGLDFPINGRDAAAIRPSSPLQKGKLQAGAGQIQVLRGIEAVGEFAPPPPGAFLDPLSFYIKALSQRVKVPFFYFDEGANMPTGVARRQADKPLIRMASTWAQGIASVASRGLGKAAEIAGIGSDLKVDVRYKPFASVDDAEGWAMIKAKNDAGVPLKVTLMEAGYTSEQVEAWYPEDETPDLSVSQLASLADTLQKLAAVVALGLITDEQVKALLPKDLMLGAPTPAGADTGE